MKKSLSLLLCAVFVMCMSSCGNKGDLYLPKEADSSPQVENETEDLKKAKDTEAETDNEKKEDGVS